MQVSKIAETISTIQIGKTGFAFLVDNHGHIITMPARGYAFFGLQPEEIPLNESPTQSILGIGQDSLQNISQQLVDGDTKLLTVNVQGVENYVGFAPLNTTGYRFAIVAPAVELNEPILISRQETQNEIRTSVGGGIALLVLAFIGAFIFSLWVGQIITRPLLRLTTVVEQVTAGDLSARADIETQDETGLLAKSFNLMTKQLNDTLSNLENRVQERTQDLEKANESLVRRAVQFESISRIARAISTTQILNDLLPQITIAISEQFSFYHVGIFLLDANREYAILVAANSEGGRRMLDRNHRLRVGGSGIVGYVTNTGQPRIALDVGQDAAYFNNPDLPETHSEMALPLRVGNEVIGALDVQSTVTNAFTQEDIDILSTLADQVSIAIQNARLYQQSQESLALAEAASTRMSGQQWKEFLATQTIEGFTFDGIDAKSIGASDKEPAQGLAIPLTLRGTRIGILKLSAPDSTRTWTDDELAIAQATAERTALAIESARLLQDAQKRAAKERTIGDISTKIGSLVDIENILQTAIRELGNTLPNTDIAIQFTPENPVTK
jgi:GAF domain-containing protein/HAMP domain-containing protein